MIQDRSRKIIGIVAFVVAILISAGIPAGYLLVRNHGETALLSLRMNINAARIGKYIYANERNWRFQGGRLGELIEASDSKNNPIYQRVIHADGRVVLGDTSELPSPAYTVRVPIEVGGKTVAVLEGLSSQWPVLQETTVVGLIACLFGLGAWAAVRLLPLRALDRVANELVAKHRQIQTVEHEAELLRERRRTAEASNQAKSGFLAMMSHEIRTPMNAVLGLAGTLLDEKLESGQRKVVEAIRDSGDSLLRILNDILDFSKLDASKMTFEHSPFAPAMLTDGVASMLANRAAAKGLTIEASSDVRLPEGLLGDSGRIRQVLINLVSNAVKFTTSGSVTIHARLVSRQEDQAIVEWIVRDSGIGIAPDRLGSLFSEFTQADNSISRRFGGTGLGLAISKRLVDRMSGSIAVESVLGKGSVFRVRLTLPVTAAPVAQAVPEFSSVTAFEAELKRRGRGLRVLFAEDNPTNQFVARQLLKDLDVHVDMVGDGLEAVDAATRFTYDLICMDMQMPEMDGLAATRMIRSLGGRLAAIPIIALTANAFPEDVRACLEAGMNQFVSKPVTREILLAAMLRALADGAVIQCGEPSRPDAANNELVKAEPAKVELVKAEPAKAEPATDSLDVSALTRLKSELGSEGVTQVVNMFIAETRSRFHRLRTDTLDGPTLVREIHTLKGAASTVCAAALAQYAAALEQRLKTGQSMVDADLAALRRSFDDYRDAVEPLTRSAAREAAV